MYIVLRIPKRKYVCVYSKSSAKMSWPFAPSSCVNNENVEATPVLFL